MLEDKCYDEVVGLHQFFEDWFNGMLPNNDAGFMRFESVMERDFSMVVPDGSTVPLPQLSERLRSAHGVDALSPIRIWIEELSTRELSPQLFLVSYQEWQERNGETTVRISSALLQASLQTPNGLQWLHVHETWLPADT